MPFLEIINTAMDFWGFVICMALLLSLRLRPESRGEYRTVVMMLLMAGLSLLTHGISVVTDGQSEAFLFFVTRVATALNCMLNFVFLGTVIIWVDRVVLKDVPMRLRLTTVTEVFLVVLALALCLSWFTGWLYYFDESHCYHRGPYYNWVQAIVGLEIAIALFVVFRNHAVLPGKRKLLYLDLVLVGFGLALHTIFPRFSGVNFALLICVLVHALGFQYLESKKVLEQERQLSEQQQQLLDLRNRTLVNQIQPHFLYNTLNTIYYLCGTDPAKARMVVHDFSFYLRTNLESLGAEEAPPFERELKHVQTYLKIEQLRFEEKLQVVYDIATVGFRLPVLTVQPLVENAVKHGLRKRTEGGLLTIRSRETDYGFEVTVEDNGVGFDPDVLPQDGRSHTGLANIRGRLAAQCHGQLEINSGLGQGTCAIIQIPKEMSI